MESQSERIRLLPPAADIAEHAEAVRGPRPLVRALLGLVLGSLAGAVMVRLTAPDPLPTVLAAPADRCSR